MTDDMIEAKLDAFRKLQDGITGVGFKIQHVDIPEHLASAALGKRYYLVLVDADYYDESNGVVKDNLTTQNNNELSINEKSEGEKLRIRACCLCGEQSFQEYCRSQGFGSSKDDYTPEEHARYFLMLKCQIDSRSELVTNKQAQGKFSELMGSFSAWKVMQRYQDNLNREY